MQYNIQFCYQLIRVAMLRQLIENSIGIDKTLGMIWSYYQADKTSTQANTYYISNQLKHAWLEKIKKSFAIFAWDRSDCTLNCLVFILIIQRYFYNLPASCSYHMRICIQGQATQNFKNSLPRNHYATVQFASLKIIKFTSKRHWAALHRFW